MIKSISELKELILWAKSQKVQRIKMGEIEVELSQYAAIESLVNSEKNTQIPIEESTSKENDDELLFASSDP